MVSRIASVCLIHLLLGISIITISYQQTSITSSASPSTQPDTQNGSPIFDRQEVIDDKNDLINIGTGNQTAGPPYVDIKSVTYSSDGRSLNSTLWLSSFSSHPSRERVGYGVLVDADLNTNTGFQGIDYKVEFTWNSTAKKWIKVFGEFSSDRNERMIVEPIDTITHLVGERTREAYVTLDVELGRMLSPESYRLFYYAYASQAKDPKSGESKGSPFIDAVRWAFVPPPEFTITTEPQFINLRAGEEKDILVIVTSRTALLPEVYLNTTKPSQTISLNFSENKLSIPSFGIATTHLKIGTDKKTTPALEKFDIRGNLTFPGQNFTVPVDLSTNVPGNTTDLQIKSKSLTKETSFLMNITKPLSLNQQFRIWLSDWFNPLSGAITSVISIATGVVGWGIGSKSKRRK